jgi:hypothetical protein
MKIKENTFFFKKLATIIRILKPNIIRGLMAPKNIFGTGFWQVYQSNKL